MRRGVRLRKVALFWSGVALFPLITTSATAEIPDRRSTEFRSVSAVVAEGDDLVLACGSDPGPGTATVFGALTVTNSLGERAAFMLVSFSGTWTDAYVYAKGFDHELKVPIQDGDTALDGGGGQVTLKQSGTLRAAWARWGTQGSCLLRVNGTDLVFAQEDPSDAVYALNVDFSGGLAASANACSEKCAWAGAAASMSYSHVSSGYIFSFFDSTRGLGVGKTKAQGPAGESFESMGNRPLLITKHTQGPWTYSLEGQVSYNGGPVLWILGTSL